jgi:predicted RNA binding protein YcfA (HicA-like mRNA interferase family)
MDSCLPSVTRVSLVGKTMTAWQVVRRIEQLGGVHMRTRGSHATYAAAVQRPDGTTLTVRAQVPMHRGDMAPGTLRSIQRQLAPVLGEGWLL